MDGYLATRRALGFKLTAPGKTLDAFVSWMDEHGEPDDPPRSGYRVGLAVHPSHSTGAVEPHPSVRRARRLVRPHHRDPARRRGPLRQPPRPSADLHPAADRRAAGRGGQIDADGSRGVVADPARAAGRDGTADQRGPEPQRRRHHRRRVRSRAAGCGSRTRSSASPGWSRCTQTTMAAIRRYQRLRDRTFPVPKTTAVFVARRGTRIARSTAGQTFQEVRTMAGLAGGRPRRRCRLHDLRHSFATNTLDRTHPRRR